MIYSQLEINALLNKGYYCLGQKILNIDNLIIYDKEYSELEIVSRKLYLLLYLLHKWNQDAEQTETLNNNITIQDRDNIINYINEVCRCIPPVVIVIPSTYWSSGYSTIGYVS